MEYISYRDYIKNEFETRKKRNPSFSLRSFAQWLGVSPAQMSQVLSGKRNLTMKMAMKISDKLCHSPQERIEFLNLLNPEAIKEKIENHDSKFVQIQDDEFSLIADWYHFAILSLSQVENSKADPRWISRRLGIDVTVAREALERLERLNIIEIKEGRYKQLSKLIKTSTDVTSKAIQKYHKQNLNVAYHKLETVPIELREFTAITMPVNTKNIAKAKKYMTEFKRKISDLLTEETNDEVYTFSAQLFPATKPKDLQ